MRVVLFGGHGLLGHALRALLASRSHAVTAPTSREVDCREMPAVAACLASCRPDAVIIAAAKVGGLQANIRHGAEFLYDNALINLVTLKACAHAGVARALVFGGACLYPRTLDRPIRETDLLEGPLEPTSEPYALAKIAAIRYATLLTRQGRCRATACVLANLYGDHDRFDAEEGNLVGSLIVKMHEAKTRGDDALTLWGDGTPRRELLHAEDAARACLTILEADQPPEILNVGPGTDAPVRAIAQQVAEAVGFGGRLTFSGGVSNGVARKLLAVDRITALGWRPLVPLEVGLRNAYRSYLAQRPHPAGVAA